MASNAVTIRDYAREIPGALSPDRSRWVFPTIVGKTTRGKETNWVIYVRLFKRNESFKLPDIPADAFVEILDSYFDSSPLPEDIYAWINVDSGQVGGKVKKSVPTIIRAGKNIGKVNATNVFTQALRDALGLYNKQVTKASGAVAAAPGVRTELYPPMLAQVLKDLKVKPRIDEDHPWYVQRKYNGVRTVTTLDCGDPDTLGDCRVIMYSRRKKLIPSFRYIKDELEPVLRMFWEEGRRLYIDGELYKHGVALQDISGISRREDQPSDVRYDYMIYDIFIANEPELTYLQRKNLLDDVFSEFEFKHCKDVETFNVYSEGEMVDLYNSFIEEKYEGAMVRIPDEKYSYSYNENHSRSLLKVKPVYDAEFEIVGYTTGERGKAAQALMVICKTEKGLKFDVTPALELDARIALAKKMSEVEPNGKTHFENHWLGRPLIVYYDEMSRDNVPQRARTRMQIRTWD